MRIVILNGEPDPASAFEAYLCELTNRLVSLGHETTKLDLAALDLKGCSGCFGCWVKTPGECVKRDDSATVCRAAINADLLLLASPMTMGFTTALLKRAADQMIQLLHPYFVVEGGEVHHRARYAHYPTMGLLLGAGCGHRRRGHRNHNSDVGPHGAQYEIAPRFHRCCQPFRGGGGR